MLVARLLYLIILPLTLAVNGHPHFGALLALLQLGAVFLSDMAAVARRDANDEPLEYVFSVADALCALIIGVVVLALFAFYEPGSRDFNAWLEPTIVGLLLICLRPCVVGIDGENAVSGFVLFVDYLASFTLKAFCEDSDSPRLCRYIAGVLSVCALLDCFRRSCKAEAAAKISGPEAVRRLLTNRYSGSSSDHILIEPIVEMLNEHMKDVAAMRAQLNFLTQGVMIIIAIGVMLFFSGVSPLLQMNQSGRPV